MDDQLQRMDMHLSELSVVPGSSTLPSLGAVQLNGSANEVENAPSTSPVPSPPGSIADAHRSDVSGRLTHDLNNILAGILCYAALLKRDTQESPLARQSVQEIVELAERAKGLLAAHGSAQQGVTEMGRGERILLVDVDGQLLEAERRLLQALGYKVTAFSSSSRARDAFLNAAYDYDLVLVDQTMPELQGVDFAEEVLQSRPTLPVVLTTGYTARVEPERIQSLGIAAVLEKPASSELLAATLRKALDRVQI